jgi:hypothetical protein
MKAHYFLFAAALVLIGCDKQQAADAANAFGKDYNTSYRDNVIKNWKSKVSDTERCAPFKERFKAAGERHESAASGAFATDMMKIWEDAKAARCKYSP